MPKSMNTDTHPKSPANQLLDDSREVGRTVADAASNTLQTLSTTVEEGAERTKDYAQQAVAATKDAALRASDAAKDMYQSASAKAEDMLVSTKEYAHQNPFPVALGTLITGLAFGYLVGLMHREQPTLRHRLFW
jgi:ElaB/YqjD/DUF883 family membrane-anchored ribosome-binding protein